MIDWTNTEAWGKCGEHASHTGGYPEGRGTCNNVHESETGSWLEAAGEGEQS